MNLSSNLVSQSNSQTPETQPVPANQPPIANQSRRTIQEDTQLTNSELLEFFSDPESDNLETTAIFSSSGSIQSQAGNFVFRPEPNYSGKVILSLTVSYSTDTADADILVNITPVNDQPNAVEDSTTLGGNAQNLLIDALANDSDIEDQALSIVSVIAAAGTESIKDGQIRYQREPGYEGEDIIEYTIADTEDSTARGQITVQVDRATRRTVFLQWSAATERENGEALNAHPQQNVNFQLQQTFATVAGQAYNLEFYAQARRDNDGHFFFSVGSLTNVEINDNVTGSWTQYSFDFIATGISTTLSFISGQSGSDTVGHYLDNISVTPVPTPVTISLPSASAWR